MQVTAFFLHKKLSFIVLNVDGIEHTTADCRITRGDEEEVCVCTSQLTVKKGNHEDLDSDIDGLIEEGIYEKRQLEVEVIHKEWKTWGISDTLIRHPQLKF